MRKMIVLDDNYKMLFDDCNVILQYNENKTRKKRNGTKEAYVFTENFYYPNVKKCLVGYCNKSLKHSSTIDDILLRIEKLESRINKF